MHLISLGKYLVALGVMSAAVGCAALPAPEAGARESSVADFVRKFASSEETPRHRAAFFDLNDDGIDEAIVYLTDRDWCGSGGCTLLVLRKLLSSWQLVSKTTVVNTPIRALNDKAHGWRTLTVTVRGGGVGRPHEAALRFDGHSYPTNPSDPIQLPKAHPQSGKVLIPE